MLSAFSTCNQLYWFNWEKIASFPIKLAKNTTIYLSQASGRSFRGNESSGSSLESSFETKLRVFHFHGEIVDVYK